ncbi:MAG: xanthine dehydrogenase small subunit, partial [Microcystaceae cyanobacterium]
MVNQVNSLKINNRTARIGTFSPNTTLLEYLRLKGYVGTKEGCGDGDCGACTVVMIGQDADGKPQYQAVNSCLIPLGCVLGKEIITVEGIGKKGALHPVQDAMVKTGGSQCGYCTPGFIMSLFAAYYQGKVDDISVEGNLCRCTGYIPIREAAKMVTGCQPTDEFAQKLEDYSFNLEYLTHQDSSHQFYRPTSLAGVIDLLKAHPNATLIAGGTDLGLELSHHNHDYPVLISLEGVEELKILKQTESEVEIGAAIPLSHVEKQLKGVFPSVDEMIHWFAARQVRNRATLGGNIGTASPIGDMLPVLLSLDAQVKLTGIEGERILPLANFFHGYRQTDLKKGEIIVSVIIPKTLPQGAVKRLSQSYKIGKRGTDDISIVAAVFTIDLDKNNKIIQARLAYGGVAATPIRALEVESMLSGKHWDIHTIQEVKPILKETFTPLSDLRASADYRKRLVGNLFEKFFVEMGGTDSYS